MFVDMCVVMFNVDIVKLLCLLSVECGLVGW